MNFTEQEITVTPGHSMRGWDSCSYYANGVELFHERTYFPHSPFKSVTSAQWLSIVGTRAEMEALAKEYGGHAMECFYIPDGADEWFLAFSDSSKAIAFCRTAAFDLWRKRTRQRIPA